MASARLILVRGLPGSGKTTFCREALDSFGVEFLGVEFLAADDWMVEPGSLVDQLDGNLDAYRFDPKRLPEVHAACQAACKRALAVDVSVVVANTFSQAWEMLPYRIMAEQFGIQFVVVDLFDGGQTNRQLAARNVHRVPEATIAAMRDRWEPWTNVLAMKP